MSVYFLRSGSKSHQPFHLDFLYPLFFFRKKGYINFVPKSALRPSVRSSVRPSVVASVTFLVNVSPLKPLDLETSNFT